MKSINEVYNLTVEKLSEHSIENVSFEADCLVEHVYGFSRSSRLTHPEADADEKLIIPFIERRINGEPLQYILGRWSFYGYDYSVGRGVLIPRPETEELVEKAIDLIKGKNNPVVFDLCSGSGCIGLTIARELPSSTVYMFEKSESAFDFLKKNAEGIKNAFPVFADIFTINGEEYIKPDLIVSNPPYIKTDDISSLQKEVLNEPEMALDGGNDGLDFYRCICGKWIPLLKTGGFVAVECGEDQAKDIISLFSPYCSNAYSVCDFNSIERIVIGEK